MHYEKASEFADYLEKGATAAEYAIMVSLVAVVLISAVGLLGIDINWYVSVRCRQISKIINPNAVRWLAERFITP